jgi:hypothetical protein
MLKTHERLRRIASDLGHIGGQSDIIDREIIAIARAELESLAVEAENEHMAKAVPMTDANQVLDVQIHGEDPERFDGMS